MTILSPRASTRRHTRGSAALVVPAAATWDGGTLEIGAGLAPVRTFDLGEGEHVETEASSEVSRSSKASSSSLIVGFLLGLTLMGGMLATWPEDGAAPAATAPAVSQSR